MQHPFQCIAAVKPNDVDDAYLLTTCGPQLISTSLRMGAIVATWTAISTTDSQKLDGDSGSEGPPAKKQKITSADENLSSIIKLTVSPNQQSVITVTEDKCLRVFTFGSSGALSLFSQRLMPKRPCAIEVLPDNETILCGDKFGDVYSLPLFGQVSEKEHASNRRQDDVPEKATFKPQATNLTVHTKRNLKALEAQMKQKNRTPKSKEPLKFEHELLLGHVSMLTDLAFVSHIVNGKETRYIVTADRDEHIRFSRAAPQAHIIEGYCLGHTEFVNKIRPVPNTDLLVSGGGDDWLGVWQWPSFSLRRKLNIKDILGRYTSKPVAVSGIWTVPAGEHFGASVLITCEKVPALFTISVDQLLQESSTLTAMSLTHPPLDVTTLNGEILVSCDSRETHQARLQTVQLGQSEISDLEVVIAALNSTDHVTDDKSLDTLFYGISNLRKRTGWGVIDHPEEPDGADGQD